MLGAASNFTDTHICISKIETSSYDSRDWTLESNQYHVHTTEIVPYTKNELSWEQKGLFRYASIKQNDHNFSALFSCLLSA